MGEYSKHEASKPATGLSRRSLLASAAVVPTAAGLASMAKAQGLASAAHSKSSKPNILIIFPDDVGLLNVSTYGRGVMGYTTPNIDRIGREGAVFTDPYAQPSCTAGRAAFITGQYPIRSGLTTVGRPGAPLGLKAATPTLAEVLKPQGYATGQFGKNHLGDRNEHLPTMHGFDEFFGNLYHLNTEEEPEQEDYPKDPEFRKKFGTRGVLRTRATNVDDATTDPRFGRVGKQTIEDTGPLTRKRMETMDEEFIAADAGAEVVGAAQAVADTVGHDAQNLVAGGVAVGVVDEFEFVHVAEENGDGPAGARVCAAVGFDALEDFLAVEEMG
jgi:arylsulfatase